jgi:hypothetical protein
LEGTVQKSGAVAHTNGVSSIMGKPGRATLRRAFVQPLERLSAAFSELRLSVITRTAAGKTAGNFCSPFVPARYFAILDLINFLREDGISAVATPYAKKWNLPYLWHI